MKNLLLILTLASFISAAKAHDHHPDLGVDVLIYDPTEELDEIIGGGVSGGNTSIYQYYNNLVDRKPTRKDLRARNMENLHQGRKELIITIDDGPTHGVTDKILDILKENNIQAAFFVLGHKIDLNGNLNKTTVRRNRALLQRMVDEGHIVANHSMEHKNIGEIKGFFKKKKIKEAILDAHNLMEPFMVNSKKWYFRAPYGSWQPRAAEIINETPYGNNYYGPLLWDIGGSMDASLFKVRRAADWGCWSKRWSVKKCLKGYINETDEKKGGVILFHDLRSQSVELIKRYIEEYKSRPDYKFISLDDVKIDLR